MTRISKNVAPFEQINGLKEKLQAANRVLVISHVNPDGDAIGSLLAMGRYLKDIGKHVTLIRDSDIPSSYLFLSEINTIESITIFKGKLDFDTVVVLECPERDRMGNIAGLLNGSETLISIDHHLGTTPYGAFNWIDDSFSSVGEMLWLYFTSVRYDYPPSVAQQLYTAVMTDTGRFRFANTTPRTMKCIADLISAGAKPDQIASEVYYNLRHSAVRLLSRALGTLEFFAEERVCALTLTNQMLSDCSAERSDAEGLIDYTMFGREVQLGVLFKEVSDSLTRVSLRSRDKIDVARIARKYGGGGHLLASGFDVPKGLPEATKEIVDLLSEVCCET